MSALGDYIHYEAENYLQYGTSKRENYENLSLSFQAYKKKRMKSIQPKINSQTIKILEERLKKQSDLFTSPDKGKTQSKRDNLKEEFFRALSSISTAEVMEQFQNRTQWKSQYLNKYPTLDKQTIEEKRQLLRNFQDKVKKILQEGSLGSAKEEDLMELQQIYEKFTKKKNSGEITESLLGQMQEELDQYRYYTWISNLAGAFGEMFVSACQDTAEDVSINTIEKVMKGIKGNDTSSGQFKIKEIEESAREQIKTYFKDYDMGDHFELNKTQDKVDVNITVNNEDVFASVKNYGSNRSVTLQKNLSLFYTLLYLNREGNFANHWLNLHAEHKDGKRISSNSKTEIDDIMAFEIRYEGLVSGNPLKESQHSNVFVFMNYKTGEVFVKSTYDILNDIDIEKLIPIRPNPASITIHNKWSPNGADNRIANLLIKMHQTNVHVSYRGNKTLLQK